MTDAELQKLLSMDSCQEMRDEIHDKLLSHFGISKDWYCDVFHSSGGVLDFDLKHKTFGCFMHITLTGSFRPNKEQLEEFYKKHTQLRKEAEEE